MIGLKFSTAALTAALVAAKPVKVSNWIKFHKTEGKEACSEYWIRNTGDRTKYETCGKTKDWSDRTSTYKDYGFNSVDEKVWYDS